MQRQRILDIALTARQQLQPLRRITFVGNRSRQLTVRRRQPKARSDERAQDEQTQRSVAACCGIHGCRLLQRDNRRIATKCDRTIGNNHSLQGQLNTAQAS
jgi:hypothetical protein